MVLIHEIDLFSTITCFLGGGVIPRIHPPEYAYCLTASKVYLDYAQDYGKLQEIKKNEKMEQSLTLKFFEYSAQKCLTLNS